MLFTQFFKSLLFFLALWIILFFSLRKTEFEYFVILTACMGALCVLSVIILPLLRYKRYRYMIADDRIELTEGIIFVRRSIVPIDRIYQTDIISGPADNLFGLVKLTVITAGSAVTIKFLEPETADKASIKINKQLSKADGEKNENN